MKYIVMECHPGYAVVVDEYGNFLKVANRRYCIGQTVTEVVPMQSPAPKKNRNWIYSLATMAACLMLLLSTILPGIKSPHASVYVKINPEVRIDVDKHDRVIGLEGVNQDGVDLIENYNYHSKDLEQVTDELVDKAIEMGYLHDAGQITLTLDSSDQVWLENHAQSLPGQLEEYLQDRIVVTVQLEAYKLEDLDDPPELRDDDDTDDDDNDDDDTDDDDTDDDDIDDDDNGDDDIDNDNNDDDDNDDDDNDDDDTDDDDNDDDSNATDQKKHGNSKPTASSTNTQNENDADDKADEYESDEDVDNEDADEDDEEDDDDEDDDEGTDDEDVDNENNRDDK